MNGPPLEQRDATARAQQPASSGAASLDLPAAQDASSPDSLRRVLGPIDATCIVIGAIIGVGIFFTPTRVAKMAGSGELALMAWAVGGVIALLGALTFAELGTLYPRTGGQYEILRDAYGPMPAFLFVFCNATYIQAGAIAIIALICSQNIGVAVSGDVPGTPVVMLLSCILIGTLVAANTLGVRWGSGIQNFTVYAKVATLLVITVLAATLQSGPALQSTEPTMASTAAGVIVTLFAAMVPAFFSYGGWQHALWIAGEVRRPQRNLPLAIVGGTLIVITVYLLANWAYLRLLGYEGVCQSGALAADAAAVAWPKWGKRVIAAAVGLSAFGVLNAQLLSGPRLLYRMSSDGRFFAPFARVSRRFNTPVAAIVLLGAIATCLLLATQLDPLISSVSKALFSIERAPKAPIDALDTLLTGVVFVDGIFFVLTGLAIFFLRRMFPGAGRTRAFGYPIVPLLFVLGEIGVVLGSCRDQNVIFGAYVGAAWIAAAAVCYLVFFRGRPIPAPPGRR